MDVKGITWVGNVYQKFEAMCLEVEEIMYEDTVKYVENQVQTVGASVKRFYSDVMQDLLPPSSEDSEKVSPRGFIGKQDSDDGISKKLNVTKKEKPAKADDDQLTRTLKGNSDNGKDVDLTPSIHVRCDVDNLCRPSGESIKGASSSLHSRKKYRDESVHKTSNLVVNENQSDRKLIPTETSCAITHKKCSCRLLPSSCESLHGFHEVSSHQTVAMKTPSVNEDTGIDSIVEGCDGIENLSDIADLSSGCQSSSEIILINSIGDNGNEIEVPSESSSVLLAQSNAPDKCLNDSLGYTRGSPQNEEARYQKYPDEDLFASHPRKSVDWNLNNEIATEREVGTIQQGDKAKLEETCVLVNEDELQILPEREGKWRPYKKKIREALYSRMRSVRKQEYEQLVLQYGGPKKLNEELREASAPMLTMVEIKKPHNDSCESEWELL